MAVYLDTMYFRMDENRYYMPVSLMVPGSQIPFVKGGDKDKATLDIIGEVIDEVKRPIGNVRETVKLNLDESLQRAAEEHPVHDQLQSAAGQIPDQVCCARKSDGTHGLIPCRRHPARHEEGAAER